jgi:membrane protease YdiL (CAAX protease family)
LTSTAPNDSDELGQNAGTLVAPVAVNPLLLLGISRTKAWAEAVGLALFAVAGNYACNQWIAARSYSWRYADSDSAAFVPELCFSLAVIAQAAILSIGRRRGMRSLGLRVDGMTGQIAWGVVIGVVAYAAGLLWRCVETYAVNAQVVDQVPQWIFTSPPIHLVAYFVVASVGTEFLYRGLLLPRLCRATGSRVAGVGLCLLVEAVPFVVVGYEWEVLASVMCTKLVICSLFLVARSLLASVIGNSLHEFIGFVLLSGASG